MENILFQLKSVVTLYGLNILAAIVILIVGRQIAWVLRGVLEKALIRAEVDGTVVSFIRNVAYYAMLVFVVLAVLSRLGISTTSLIAVVGAAGLAVGLALQGSMANFAAGLLMILFRPFQVGHFIEASGASGTVEQIQIFATHLKTPDNRVVIMPNAKVMGDKIVNYSAEETRRIELHVGVSYGDDLKNVREVLQEIVASDDRILKEPEPIIVVGELADSSVNWIVRAWVETGTYWDVYYDLNEKVKTRFDQEGISIPYPQRDIHVYQLTPTPQT